MIWSTPSSSCYPGRSCWQLWIAATSPRWAPPQRSCSLSAEEVGAAVGVVAVDELAQRQIVLWRLGAILLHQHSRRCLRRLPRHAHESVAAFRLADAFPGQLDGEVVEAGEPCGKDQAIDGAWRRRLARIQIVEGILEKHRIGPHQALLGVLARGLERLRGAVMGIDAVESKAVLPQQHVDVGKRLLPAVHLNELDLAEDCYTAFVEQVLCAFEDLVLAALRVELEDLAEWRRRDVIQRTRR